MRWLWMTLVLVALSVPRASAAETEIDQGPGEALALFFDTAHRGDFELAAASLSLESLPAESRDKEGPRLARRLMFLLDQQLTLDPTQLARASEGRVRVGELPLGRLQVPVELVRRDGTWVFSSQIVRSIDPLFAEHGWPLWERLPAALVTRGIWVLAHWQWLGLVLLLVLSVLVSRALSAVFKPLMLRLAKLSVTTLDDRLVAALDRPVRALLFLVLIVFGTRGLAFPASAQSLVDDVAKSAAIATAMWAVLILSRLVAEVFNARSVDGGNEQAGRGLRTQVALMHRVADAIVLIVGGALMLLQFPGVRAIGMSLLASAGVAGVVIGLAAQRSISNLLAGIQISLTQPIRIGDTVVVEGEWGWIEELTLTYVVVKTWDLRRLVLPISYFLEKPFQNWTRASTEILGTVFVYADYRVDVAAARAELARILEGQLGKLWDGKTQGLQVTDLSERSMTLRAVVSASDAGRVWDLRCVVREKLVTWLQQQHPDALPRVRAESLALGTTDVAPASVAASVKQAPPKSA